MSTSKFGENDGSIPTRIDRLAVLAGGMKCGSTSLYHALAQHPEVAPSRPKETNFFSMRGHWRRGMAWYERRFSWRENHRIVLDASPSYGRVHQFPQAVDRLARLEADTRILFVARDPIERIRSHARHAMAAPWGGRVRQGGLPPGLVKASDYAATLDAYAKALGRERVHVVTLDDLRASTATTMEGICEFLDIEPMPLQMPSRNRASPRLWQMHAFWQTLYRRHCGPRRRRALRTTAYHVRRVPGLRRAMFSPAVASPLPDGWEETAREELAPSMQRLHDRWGIDVSRWGY